MGRNTGPDVRGGRVLVFGADTRLGQTTLGEIKRCAMEPVGFTREALGDDPVGFVHEAIRRATPVAVINCIADPDGGLPPHPVDFLVGAIAPTRAMVQQCTSSRVLYVHASHSRVFGQRQKDESGRAYLTEDPVQTTPDDCWSGPLVDLEHAVLTRTHECSPVQYRYGAGCGYALLRFPHLLHPGNHREDRPQLTLDRAVLLGLQQGREFAVPQRETQVGVLTTKFAAKALVEVVRRGRTFQPGIYNVCSEPASVRELFTYLQLKGFNCDLSDMGTSNAPIIYGVDRDTAMSNSKWLKAGMPDPGSWRDALDTMIAYARKNGLASQY